MPFEEALNLLTRDERIHAMIYAMNSLLISKGVYTRKEFQALGMESASKETRKKLCSTRRAGMPVSLQA